MSDQEMLDADPDDNQLHQGDVLRWEHDLASPWREHALIVTADCDLRLNKTRGLVSYVPVVKFGSYIQHIWAPEFVEKRMSHQRRVGLAAIRKAFESARGSYTLTDEAALAWVLREDAEAIAGAVFTGESSKNKERSSLIVAIKKLSNALTAEKEILGTAGDFLEMLYTRVSIITGKTGGDGREEIGRSLEGHCTSLPGDVFFMNSVPGASRGHFAIIRHIYQAAESDIDLDPVARPGARLPLRRVGRLGSPYVFALTQRLGKVFSDVGLPSSHPENLRASLSLQLGAVLP